MRPKRLSILAMMAIIVMIALAFAALRNPTVLGASLIFMATVAFLATAILGAIARRGRARLTWAGVAVFGWAYLAMSFGPFPNTNGAICPPFPTQILLESVRHVREEADQALSVQHAPWGLGRSDSPPGAEAILNAPRTAYWYALADADGPGSAMVVASAPPGPSRRPPCRAFLTSIGGINGESAILGRDPVRPPGRSDRSRAPLGETRGDRPSERRMIPA